jgi:hypothetical protein
MFNKIKGAIIESNKEIVKAINAFDDEANTLSMYKNETINDFDILIEEKDLKLFKDAQKH